MLQGFGSRRHDRAFFSRGFPALLPAPKGSRKSPEIENPRAVYADWESLRDKAQWDAVVAGKKPVRNRSPVASEVRKARLTCPPARCPPACLPACLLFVLRSVPCLYFLFSDEMCAPHAWRRRSFCPVSVGRSHRCFGFSALVGTRVCVMRVPALLCNTGLLCAFSGRTRRSPLTLVCVAMSLRSWVRAWVHVCIFGCCAFVPGAQTDYSAFEEMLSGGARVSSNNLGLKAAEKKLAKRVEKKVHVEKGYVSRRGTRRLCPRNVSPRFPPRRCCLRG